MAAENDGNCALLAEKWLGHAQNCASFATIVLGTSVGGGLMINHQLVRGKHLLAGEFGYMLSDRNEGLGTLEHRRVNQNSCGRNSRVYRRSNNQWAAH